MSGKRVTVLYFSGTGGTRLIAELLAELLSASLGSEICGIEDPRALDLAARAEFLVLLYPTYYLSVPASMSEFVERLGRRDPPKPAYIVTSFELYPENSVRRMALGLKSRGFSVVGSGIVRAPGSDATCVLPSFLVPWLYRFEKGLPGKLRALAREIRSLAESADPRESIPPPKWYTPFTQLLQVLFLNRFHKWRFRFRVLEDRCTLCGACATRCARNAWTMSDGALVHLPESCELCTGCIHRCPKKAIVLIKGLKDNPRLDARLYARLRAEAREGFDL
jgi:ferredoxin/flavodoxin